MPEVSTVPPPPSGEARTAAEAIPFKTEPKSLAEQGGEALLATLVLLALAVAVLVWLRRKFGWSFREPAAMRGFGRLTVVDKVGVGGQSSVVVVRYRHKDYVLVQTTHAIAKIDEFPVEASEGGNQPRPPSR